MAYPSVTYTFSNSTTADATQVNQNFTDLINGLSDGTKDLSISALTVAGTATLNGAVNIGNATSDDLTITGYLASSFIPKTNQTYDIGTADLGLRALYLGVASAGSLTAKVIASASIAANRIFTVPDAGTDASFVMTAGTQTISGAKTFDTAGNAIKGITSGSAIAAGYIGEVIETSSAITSTALTTSDSDINNASLPLTAGRWEIKYSATLSVITGSGAGDASYAYCVITNSSNTHIGKTQRILYVKTVAALANSAISCVSASCVVDISTNTTYKLRGKLINGTGSGSASIEVSTGTYDSTFYAKRIG